MSDRVHPGETTPSHASQPPPGTYVVQIPKDQVYRVPPPENATLYKHYTSRRKPRRSCFCWFLSLLISLVLIATIAALVFYLVFRPESPDYTLHAIAFRGFNLTSSPTISLDIDLAVRADNPNRKLGIYYRPQSSVDLFYTDVKLCQGSLQAFYQPRNNVTEFRTALTGSGIRLTAAVRDGLVEAQSQAKVAFKLHVRAPVRIKVGSIKTWTITVKVDCDITVDKLTPEANIVSKDCNYGVDPW